jgi:hypothetical protein
MGTSVTSLLRGVVSQAVGLIVDDGFIAVGAVAALVLTGLLASASISLVPHDALGVVLFAIVTIVLLGSLARAGRAAQAHAVEAPAAGPPIS